MDSERLQRIAEGLRRDDEDAAREFVEHFSPALERLAASQMASWLAVKTSPASVVQSAFMTFLQNLRRTLDRKDDIGKLLISIVLNKVRDRARHHRAQMRDVRREEHLSASDGGEDGGAYGVAAVAPSPEQAVVFAEEFERFVGSLDATDQTILRGKLLDESDQTIAVAIGLTDRTVRGRFEKMKQRWQGEQCDE